MKKYCKNCKYGDINFWGYNECWKFDEEIDTFTSKHTAQREIDSITFNKNNNCIYFEFKNKLKEFLYNLLSKIKKHNTEAKEFYKNFNKYGIG